MFKKDEASPCIVPERSVTEMIEEYYRNPLIQFMSGFDDGLPKNPIPMKRDPVIESILNRDEV